MGYEITGSGVEKARQLAVLLKTADPVLKRELRKALRSAGNTAADAARSSILAMPGTKVGNPPLRAAVAKSVTVRVGLASTVKVSIVAEPNKMPAGMGNMPKRLNQETFKHPVYGSKLGEQASVLLRKAGGKGGGHGRAWTWVTQQGQPGWFDDSIRQTGPDAQQKISDAMDTTASYITGAL